LLERRKNRVSPWSDVEFSHKESELSPEAEEKAALASVPEAGWVWDLP